MIKMSSKEYVALKKLIKAIEEFDENAFINIIDFKDESNIEYTLSQNALGQNTGLTFFKNYHNYWLQ